MSAILVPSVPVRRNVHRVAGAFRGLLVATGLLLLSFPVDAGGHRGGGGGGGSAPSRGGSGGGHSYSAGPRSSSGGGRSYSAAPQRSSGGTRSYVNRSYAGGSRSYTASTRSSSGGERTSTASSTRGTYGDRSYTSSGTRSSSGVHTLSATGSRGGQGGPPSGGGNPGSHPGGGPGGGGSGGHPGGGHPGGGHGGGGYHGGYHHGWYCPPTYYAGTSWFWGGPWDWWWGWGGGWGWGWGPYGYGGGVYVIDEGAPVANQYARVDTDVSPETAELYLDGTFIGQADDFDGFPDYLYLETGKYRLEFRHPYYETVVKELDVRAGQAIALNDEMKLLPGKKKLAVVDPEDRGTPLGRVFGKPKAEGQTRDRTGRFEVEGGTDAGEAAEVEAQEVDVMPTASPRPDAGSALPPAEAAPAPRGHIRFEVEPDDAAVYVDDRYVGTAAELGDRPRGLWVKAGKHTVTVVRPGYVSKTVEVEPKPGAAIDVVIELEK